MGLRCLLVVALLSSGCYEPNAPTSESAGRYHLSDLRGGMSLTLAEDGTFVCKLSLDCFGNFQEFVGDWHQKGDRILMDPFYEFTGEMRRVENEGDTLLVPQEMDHWVRAEGPSRRNCFVPASRVDAYGPRF